MQFHPLSPLQTDKNIYSHTHTHKLQYSTSDSIVEKSTVFDTLGRWDNGIDDWDKKGESERNYEEEKWFWAVVM